jgi:HrpA-like RNA helicase
MAHPAEFFNDVNTVNRELADSVAVLSVEGQQYDVDIYYAEAAVSDYAISAVETVWKIHCSEECAEGNILVFLTGQVRVIRDSVMVGNFSFSFRSFHYFVDIHFFLLLDFA